MTHKTIFHYVKVALIMGGILPLLAFGQVKKNSIDKKELMNCSIQEIDSLFDIKNRTFKYEAIKEYTDEICQKLNGSVLIAVNDSIIVEKNVGYLRFFEKSNNFSNISEENLQKKRENNNNQIQSTTFFELASLTKQFTAVAILKLAEDKKIDLKEKVVTFFPDFPYTNVTIHHLLTHTSGVPEYLDFPVKYFKDTSQTTTNEEIINILIKQKPPQEYHPGNRFLYTNTNYVLLAKIIEKVSGLTFETYIRNNLLKPVGIEFAFFITEFALQDSSTIARGHLLSKKEVVFDYLDGTVGDKGMYCTIEGLYKWEKALFSGEIITQHSLEMATNKQNFLNNKKVSNEIYGYGFRIEESPSKDKIIFHGGLWHGFQNLMIYRPKDNTYIIFLSNYRNKAHFRKSDQYFHILDGA